MNRTVKEITRSLGTNKNVIYRIIEKLGLEPVQDAENTTSKVYSDEAYLEIKKEFNSLQARHKDARNQVSDTSQTELVTMLENQIRRYETEIDRLNHIIESKDETIKQLTNDLTETVKTSHLESMRYQELIAREQDTKLLLTAQSETRFNLFRPSTWKRSKNAKSPDLSPLSEQDQTRDESKI